MIFDSDPLTFDLGLFPAKNSRNRAKTNHIFSGKVRGDKALILQYLDSPMANFFPLGDFFLLLLFQPCSG